DRRASFGRRLRAEGELLLFGTGGGFCVTTGTTVTGEGCSDAVCDASAGRAAVFRPRSDEDETLAARSAEVDLYAGRAEVRRHARRPRELDAVEVGERRRDFVEQCAEDTWPRLLECRPELILGPVASNARQVENERPVEQVALRREVLDSVHQHRPLHVDQDFLGIG